MNAQEARETALKVNAERNNKEANEEYRKVQEVIERYAKMGLFRTTVEINNFLLTEKIIEMLEKEGFYCEESTQSAFYFDEQYKPIESTGKGYINIVWEYLRKGPHNMNQTNCDCCNKQDISYDQFISIQRLTVFGPSEKRIYLCDDCIEEIGFKVIRLVDIKERTA